MSKVSSAQIPTPIRLSTTVGHFGGWQWAGPPAGATLLFAHATGFNASAYKTLLTGLADRVRVIALNQRGHGTTDLPVEPASLRSWDVYANDMVSVLDSLSCGPVHYAGHSMGAVVGLLACSERPDLFRSLTLFDPVLMPPIWYRLMRSPVAGLVGNRIKLAAAARKRRCDWPDRETVRLSYQGRGIFRSLSEQVVEDYLEDGLRVTSSGVTLSCKPAWEAATFRGQGHLLWPAIRRLAAMPLTILKAETGSTFRVENQRILRIHPHANIHTMEGCGHFAPLEQTARARQYLHQGMGFDLRQTP